MKKTLWILLAIIAVGGIYVWSVYNSLVTGGVAIDNQWAQVETQYQRRLDLIPNLVATTKGIFKQEQKVFGDLAEARTKYAGAATVNDKAAAASQLEGALSRLLVVVENYPSLRSAEAVTTLMSQLEGTENRVSVERKRYNDAVGNYDLKVATFPSSLVARMFGFSAKAYFEAATGAEVAPKVEL